MTILGTRPELIKMSRVVAEFDRHTKHVLGRKLINAPRGIPKISWS